MDLISVIVPVYNVEKYLNKCIESIANQTYKNLEIILVDDGSTDSSGAICDQWAKKDDRIKVIHKENGGLSDARNKGLYIASGNYIGFVDSDDWIDYEMYEKLLSLSKSYNADISSCGVLKIWDNNETRKLTKDNGLQVLNNIESMEALIESSYLIQTVWNKLYKRRILNGLEFPYGLIHEDEFWTWKAISHSSKTVTTDEPLYYYFQHKESIMGNGYTGFPLNFINAKCERHKYIQTYIPQLVNKSCKDILLSCLYEGQQVIKHHKSKDKFKLLSEINKTAKNFYPEKTYLNTLNFKTKILIYLIHNFFIPICYIYSIK